MNKKLKFVVLGSNCFSGSHMVDELLKDTNNVVVGISRSPEKSILYLPYKKADLRNFSFYQVDMLREPDKLINLLDLIQPDYIINFAALSEVQVSIFRPIDYFQTNCLSLITLCNQLRNRQSSHYLKGFIQISSAEVYGNCKKPVLESSITAPTTPYAISKLAADLYLQSLFRIFEFPVMIIRSTNVYGNHQQLYKIIPRSVIYLNTGRKIELHGNGKNARCFLHIRDLVQGVIAAIQHGKMGEIYHFAVPQESTIAEIVQKICEFMGYDFKTNTIPVEDRQGADRKYLLDYTKSVNEIKWKPTISIDTGLKDVIEWIKANWTDILNEPHIYMHKP